MDSLASLMYSPPGRVGYTYILYQHPLTGYYQWINNPNFADAFNMVQIYPVFISKGFGLNRFGRTPFGG